MSISHWNNRVMKRTYTHLEGTPDEFTEDYFAIHEVYYDDEGEVTTYTTEPTSPRGENIEELRQSLEWMMEATKKPVLNYDKIIDNDE